MNFIWLLEMYCKSNNERKGRSSFSGPLTQSGRKRGSQDRNTHQSVDYPSRFHEGTCSMNVKFTYIAA